MPQTRQRRARWSLSKTLKRGRASTTGSTQVTVGRAATVFKVRTAERDSGGRPAPVMALVDRAWWLDVDSTVQDIVASAQLIGRSIDPTELAADLNSRAGRGKAIRRLRWVLTAPRRLLSVAWTWLRKRWPRDGQDARSTRQSRIGLHRIRRTPWEG